MYPMASWLPYFPRQFCGLTQKITRTSSLNWHFTELMFTAKRLQLGIRVHVWDCGVPTLDAR